MKITITRRFHFSASHRYWVPSWSKEENLRRFGKLAREHGHNYILEVTVTGPLDPQTGMILNLTELKERVERVLADYDHRYLNRDNPDFRNRNPSTENLAWVLAKRIAAILPQGIRLERIRLYESEDLYAEAYPEDEEQTLGRAYEFSAAHRLFAPGAPEEENRRHFGEDTFSHGHSYRLEVEIRGKPDPLTGWILDLSELDRTVAEVLEPLDHARLDTDVPAFRNQNPTGENIARFLFKELRQRLGSKLRRIRLRETRNNYFEAEEA